MCLEKLKKIEYDSHNDHDSEQLSLEISRWRSHK